MTMVYAYRNGVIGFGRKVPKGAISIANGPDKKIRNAVKTLARHAYDNETLLIPGVPEAANDKEAFSALMEFHGRLKDYIGE